MKANEAPEKIWVHELSAKELNVPLKEYHIEYTRTDAFIKKAKKWFEKQNEWFDPNGNRHCDLNDFEDFKNYMAQYIDKDALVAEIWSKKKYAQTLGDNAINSSMQQFYDGMKQGCVDILSFLDTLEVKEVDLEKEVRKYVQKHFTIDKEQLDRFGIKEKDYMYSMDKSDILLIAKHFFELGLTQKGE